MVQTGLKGVHCQIDHSGSLVSRSLVCLWTSRKARTEGTFNIIHRIMRPSGVESKTGVPGRSWGSQVPCLCIVLALLPCPRKHGTSAFIGCSRQGKRQSAVHVPMHVTLVYQVSAQMGSDLFSGRKATPRRNGGFVNTHCRGLA